MLKNLLRPLILRYPTPFYRLRWLGQKVEALLPWVGWRISRARRAAVEARRRPRTPKQVVFVTEAPGAREAKIAWALRQAGWEVVLLSRRPPSESFRSCFSRHEAYRDRWDALRRASAYSPVAFHVFVHWLYEIALAFVRNPPGKVVVDSNDLLTGFARDAVIRSRFPGQTDLERLVLEEAPALSCRSLETQYLKKAFGFKYRGKRIFFPDFTMTIPPSADDAPRSAEIHVVHIGILSTEKHEPHFTTAHFQDIAERLARDKVHFHVYGGAAMFGSYEETYADFLALEQKTPYFHLHREKPIPALIKELRGYTFGLHVAGSHLHYREHQPDYFPAQAHYFIPGRIFEHMSAGLPIILHEGRAPLWMTRHLGKALLADPGFLDAPGDWLRKRLPTPEERPRLDSAWERLDIRRHVHRLTRFYESIPDLG